MVEYRETIMSDAGQFILARALHVLGVVLWIGGVAFVTTVLLPALQRQERNGDRLALFEALEGRFAWQARLTTLLTGLSGFYMLYWLGAWDRYRQAEFWWIHLMTAVWFVFTLVLFVLEPLVLHHKFHEMALQDEVRAFRLVRRMHVVLLTISLVAVLGGMLGAHGGLV